MRYLPDAPNHTLPKQTLSPELRDLCTQAAARLETLGLSPKEAKSRLWDTIKDAVPSEPLGEADLARITPEIIAAAERDVRRHRESNARAAAALTQAEERFTKGQLLKSNGNCRSCGQAVRFIRNAETGKSPPSNLDGTSHFATCPQAGQWRRTK
jgi:hypothetical protein